MVVSVMLVVAIVIFVVAIAAMAWARVGGAVPTGVCLARLPGAACACWLELLHEAVDNCKYDFSPVRKSAQRQIFGLKCVMQPPLIFLGRPRGEPSYASLTSTTPF